MTSKRSITSDLENAKDAVLGDLTPDERAALAVCVAADGDHERFEELLATAPVDVYKSTDREFAKRMRSLETVAVYALWELERGALQFDLERVRGKYEEQLSDEIGDYEGDAIEAAARFLVDHRAWSRFAEDDVGVSLEEFLRFPLSDGAAPVFERIESTARIADGSAFDVDVDGVGWAADASIDVDVAVDRKYAQIEV